MKITMRRPKGSEAHKIDFGEVKMLSYARYLKGTFVKKISNRCTLF